MVRTRRIPPLATALFIFTAPGWAAEAKTTANSASEAVSVGNPLSGSNAHIAPPSTGMTAPGLLPPIQTPISVPIIQGPIFAIAPLPLEVAQHPCAPSVLAPLSLPQSALNTPSAPVTTISSEKSPAGQPTAEYTEQPRSPPGPELIERAKATAASLTGQAGAVIQTPDAKGARHYIRGIMGSQTPTDAETAALLEDYMSAKGIAPASKRGRALRLELLASMLKAQEEAVAQLDPRLRSSGPSILEAAKKYGASPAHIEETVKKRGLTRILAGTNSKEQADRILDSVLTQERFDLLLARYPRNQQGDLMRDVANNMLSRSGKSIEEISRDGVFVYADFNGRSLTHASAGRDPDLSSPNVIFYVRFEDNKWRINVYRQNYGHEWQGGADSLFVKAFQHWLTLGDVPSADIISQ